MQIMEGDVIATIESTTQYIAHYHTGGVPGRHEIDETQELNYPADHEGDRRHRLQGLCRAGVHARAAGRAGVAQTGCDDLRRVSSVGALRSRRRAPSVEPTKAIRSSVSAGTQILHSVTGRCCQPSWKSPALKML